MGWIMHSVSPKSVALRVIGHYFMSAPLPSQQQTLDEIVSEILHAGKNLNRTTLCIKLVSRIELACSVEEEQHYCQLLGLLFGDSGLAHAPLIERKI